MFPKAVSSQFRSATLFAVRWQCKALLALLLAAGSLLSTALSVYADPQAGAPITFTLSTFQLDKFDKQTVPPSLLNEEATSAAAVVEIQPAAYPRLLEIERQIYGREYQGQPVPQRISRLEYTLFGNRQLGDLPVRYARVVERVNRKNAQNSAENRDRMVDYMEQKLFGQAYGEETMDSRFRRLENHVFGKTFETYPLDLRFKKLSYTLPVMSRGVKITSRTRDAVVANTFEPVIPETLSARKAPAENFDAVELDVSADASAVPNGDNNHPAPASAISSPMASAESAAMHASDQTPLSTAHPRVIMPQQRTAAQSSALEMPVGAGSGRVGDYTLNVYRTGANQVLRWQRLPVKLYIRNAQATQAAFFSTAIRQWREVFPIEMVTSAGAADIIVDTLSGAPNTVLTRPVLHLDSQRRIRSVVMIQAAPFLALPSFAASRALLHQVGHAIGIWGHSEDANDVMAAFGFEKTDIPAAWLRRSALAEVKSQTKYDAQSVYPNVSHSPYISQRDQNTLRKLYTLPASDLSAYHPTR